MRFAGDLISELARHKELRMIVRFSSFSLKCQALSGKEVCGKLNARYIVSGQVQFTETAILWSHELIDGHSDEMVWSAQAVALYPNYARAWHAAAAVHTFDINQCLTDEWTEEHVAQALSEEHKATGLDSSQATAYSGLAALLLLNGQPAQATLSTVHAMELGPGEPLILNVHSFILLHTG